MLRERIVAACVAAFACGVAAQEYPAQAKLISIPAGAGQPAVCGVGDVNGDGHPDVAARLGSDAGVVRVVSGADGSTLFSVACPKLIAGAQDVGLAACGDLDLDGMPDLVVGLPGAGTAGDASGELRVVSGTDGSTLLALVGPAAGALFGRHVAGLLDADGDGVPDIAVSRAAPQAAVELRSGATGAVLRTWLAQPGDADFAYAVESAGDVDADGVLDVAISVRSTPSGLGAARVYSGRTGDLKLALPGLAWNGFNNGFATAAGDLNGDGHDDVATVTGDDNRVVVSSGADGSTLLAFAPAPDGNDVQAVTLVGDTTGDGLPDYAVGLTSQDPESAGFVALRSGADGSEIFDVFNGTGDHSAPWLYSGSQWGAPVRGVGDVDQDGVPDFIVGSNGPQKVFSGALSPFKIDFADDLQLIGHDLLATGSLQADSPLQLQVKNFPAGAPVLIVVGLTAAKLPFKGATLVPEVDLVLGPLTTDANGSATLNAVWPAALPAGTEIWLQAWSAPLPTSSWSASNGLTAKS
jgi:hypothetical protein